LINTLRNSGHELIERYNLVLPAGVWPRKNFGLPMLLEVNAPLYEESDKHRGISLRRLAGRGFRPSCNGRASGHGASAGCAAGRDRMFSNHAWHRFMQRLDRIIDCCLTTRRDARRELTCKVGTTT
jgi:hypothetical protein